MLLRLSPRQFRNREGRKRRGAAIVEFAFIAPIMFAVVLGIIEMGRAMMVTELMLHSTRHGCRVGVLPGNTSSDVRSAVDELLSGSGIDGETTTVLVNGVEGEVAEADRGDTIAVTVSIPFSEVAWIPGDTLAGAVLSKTTIMRKE